MPKFTDVKILDYVEKNNFKNQTFAEWVESEFEHQASIDPRLQAVEQAYYSKKRSEMALPEAFGPIVKMEHNLLQVLTDMEVLGVYVDREELQNLRSELQEKARLLLAEMRDLVGEDFNPLSAKQVQHILYDRMRIPTGKKIKTGFSVDSETLAEISKSHAIAGMILDYRGYEKLRSTYCDGLIERINPETHRIHTTYKQTFTSTGRLSSENPNLQNIPAGDGYAARIKSAFRPQSKNMQYVVADYSQVELRVLAMLS
jgi:DNA polymerase-1